MASRVIASIQAKTQRHAVRLWSGTLVDCLGKMEAANRDIAAVLLRLFRKVPGVCSLSSEHRLSVGE